MDIRKALLRPFSKYSFLFFGKTSRTHIQFFRYLFVGGISAIVDTSIFAILVIPFSTHYLVAQTFGFLAGITTNYLLSVSWVFERSRRMLSETSLFLATGIIGLLLSYLLLWIFIDVFGLTAFQNMAAKLLTTALVLIWNFTSRKILVFQKQPL